MRDNETCDVNAEIDSLRVRVRRLARFAKFVDRWGREQGYTTRHNLRRRARRVLEGLDDV